VRGIAPAAMRRLLEYPWPGNVRELENVIERALVLTDGTEVGVEQLPTALRSPAAAPVAAEGDLSVKRGTERLERDLIVRALARTGGNRTRAAQLLELSHRALLYKIREYDLDS
jgi:two-component system response regulator AtoC